jgi:hypothetical protein
MRKANQQDDGKKPLSAYIMVTAVAIVTLWLVYLVNVELLPLLFDIDREAYRQALIDLATQTLTTAIGVLLGLLGFHALGWPPQTPGGDKLQEDASAQEAGRSGGEHCEERKKNMRYELLHSYRPPERLACLPACQNNFSVETQRPASEAPR